MANEPRLAVESIAGRRDYQEDSVVAKSLSDGRTLVAVADGMGGHAAGEVASALALETLERCLEEGVPLDEAVVRANAEVFEKAKEPGKKGMGTTLVAALVEDGEYMIANVGDSRGYLVSPDGIRQVTDDHSFAAEAERQGQPVAEEMAIRYKDALTRSIGTDARVEVDVFGPFPVESDTALLVCSDGLYKVLDDETIRRLFVQSSSPVGAAQALVTTAYDDGSDDNISAAIVEYGEVPRTPAQATLPIDFEPADPGGDTVPLPAVEAAAVEPTAEHVEPAAAAGPHDHLPDDAPASEAVRAPGGLGTAPIVITVIVIAVLLALFVF